MTKAELVSNLAKAGSSEPQSEAKIIISEFFGVELHTQVLYPEKDYDGEKLAEIISKRADGVPLQYIIGYSYFCGEKYFLNPDCLIPRQDTETLVHKAAELLPKNARFADLCTGSGCVAISTLCKRTDSTALALDISEGAVEAARKNALYNGVADRIEIFSADIFTSTLGNEKFDAILSNPPYIPTDTVNSLSKEVLSEPRIALDGGADGLDFYRFIIENYKINLKDGGFFAFEIGYDQADSISQISSFHGYSCEIYRDFGGMARVAVLSKTKTES